MLEMPGTWNASFNKWNNPREARWATNCRAIVAGLSKPVGAHFMTPCAPDARN
jgi:hypothetical protein